MPIPSPRRPIPRSTLEGGGDDSSRPRRGGPRHRGCDARRIGARAQSGAARLAGGRPARPGARGDDSIRARGAARGRLRGADRARAGAGPPVGGGPSARLGGGGAPRLRRFLGLQLSSLAGGGARRGGRGEGPLERGEGRPGFVRHAPAGALAPRARAAPRVGEAAADPRAVSLARLRAGGRKGAGAGLAGLERSGALPSTDAASASTAAPTSGPTGPTSRPTSSRSSGCRCCRSRPTA